MKYTITTSTTIASTISKKLVNNSDLISRIIILKQTNITHSSSCRSANGSINLSLLITTITITITIITNTIHIVPVDIDITNSTIVIQHDAIENIIYGTTIGITSIGTTATSSIPMID